MRLERSFRCPRHKHVFEPVDRRCQFILLNGARRVDILWARLGALAHERASPDPFMLRENVHALLSALVARIEVVPLRHGDGGRPDKEWIEAVDGARRIRYSPSEMGFSSLRTSQGFTLRNLVMKSDISTTRSRTTGK